MGLGLGFEAERGAYERERLVGLQGHGLRVRVRGGVKRREGRGGYVDGTWLDSVTDSGQGSGSAES